MKHKLELKVRKHFLVILFAVLVAAALVLQWIYDWHLHQQNNSQLSGQPIIASLIDDAINNLDESAPVEAQTGNVYLPDVKLMLPAPPSHDPSLRQIEYSNATYNANFDLQVTTRNIINQSENKLLIAQANAQNQHNSSANELLAIFHQVPNLQACSRGVQLFYSPQNNNGPTYKLRFTKKLNSGKTLYAYTETTCQAEQMPALVNYLKQIQSY